MLLSLLSFCWAACKKESSKVTYLSYSGQVQGNYNFHSLHYSTGEFKSDTWDSTYDDKVAVVIDRSTNTIKFSFHPNNFKAQPYATEYSYPLDQTSNAYSTQHASHVVQSFYMTGDSLYTSYNYYNGYGPNYTKHQISFSGKTLP